MKLIDEELKELYQQQTARSARGRAECLAEESLRRAAMGELSQAERERVADHLMTCSDCAEEYHLSRSLKPWAEQVAAAYGEPALEAKVGGKRSRWAVPIQTLWEQIVWVPRWRAAAVVAMLVVAVGVSLILWRATKPSHEPVPGERGEDSVAMTVDPAHRALLREPPARLGWSAVASADRYQVILYDAELTAIWESPPMTTTSILLPDSVRQGLQRGQLYFWRVRVHGAMEPRHSRLFQFIVTTDGHR